MIPRLLHYAAALALAVAGVLLLEAHGPALLAAAEARGYVVERPGFVWVLLLVPLLVAVRAHTLSDLPRVQQGLSLLLKAAFIAALTLSLLDIEEVASDPARSATVFVVDVSDSVPDAMVSRAREAAAATWEAREDHLVRLVVFAREAREVPLPEAADPAPEGEIADRAEPAPEREVAGTEGAPPFPEIPRLEGDLGQGTDIEAGLRLALTLLPEGHLPRIVLATDGLETHGSLAVVGELAARFGVPVHYLDLTDVEPPSELMVTAVRVPDDLKPNVPFVTIATVRVTDPMAIRCELLVDGVVAETEELTLPRGEHEVTLETRLREGGERELAVACEPEDPDRDRFATNNRFAIPIRVAERPRLLYIEGERLYARNLAAALAEDFDVEHRGARGVPSSLADAQRFDLIFISDVPRAGEMGHENMTTGQMRVLEQYARAGGGLVFSGGQDSLGPGGYGQTYLERSVLPVWLDVQRRQDIPGVALMLAIDRSGSMSGDQLELAKQAAIATLSVLQPSDLLGVIAFDSRPNVVVRPQRAANRYRITEIVSRIRAGGGTNIFAALDQAYIELAAVDARIKHVILLTDGHSNRAGILELVARSHDDKITTTAVGLGVGADQELLRRVAEEGRGRYYFSANPRNVPQLFVKETSEVSRRALVEDRFQPRVDPRFRNLQMFSGIDMARAPSLIGYVSTRAKPRAEVIMTSHLGEPILARWRLGLGWVVVWTSDVKNRWSHFWLSWPGYAKFWRQLVRDTMRVEREDPAYVMTADVAHGELTLGVDAVDDADRFIDGVESEVTVTGPGGEEHQVALTQVAAGRYEGTLTLPRYGPYVIRGQHAPRGDPEATHRSFATVAWPFPEEHLLGAPDLAEVARLASLTGGVADPTPAQLFDVGDALVERRLPLWPQPLYLALALLLADVALRRVRLYGKTRVPWSQVRGAA